MGVEAPAATGDDRAFPAGLAQAGQALLTRDDARMLLNEVQRVLEDVQARRRGAVEGHLQGIDLFVGAVGLYDSETGWRQAQATEFDNHMIALRSSTGARPAAVNGIRRKQLEGKFDEWRQQRDQLTALIRHELG